MSKENKKTIPNFLKRPEGAPDAKQYRALSASLENFVENEAKRILNGGEKVLDRVELEKVFTKHNFTLQDFGLDVERDDDALMAHLENVHEDLDIAALLDERYGDDENMEIPSINEVEEMMRDFGPKD